MVTVDSDPLSICAELPLEAEFHPLGFPLQLATNSAAVMEAASDGAAGELSAALGLRDGAARG